MKRLIKLYLKLSALILIFLSVHFSAQTLVDTLKQRLSTQKGKERIGTLIALSQQNVYFDSKQSREYALEALSLANQNNDEINKAEAYYYLGFSEYRLGNYQVALQYLNNASETWKNLKNDNSLATARNLIAIVYYYIGRYEISTKLYSQNLVYYKSKNNMIYYSKMLTNIANVYLKKENFEKALENLLLAERFARKYSANDSYYLGNLLCNIGEAYFGKKKHELALKNYYEALEYLNRIKLTDGIANVQQDIGLAYLELKNYSESINYFNLALKNYSEINYTKGVMDVKDNIIKYFKEVKKPDIALKEAESLEEIATSAKDTLMLAKSYNHFADIYEAKGNCVLASKFFRKYLNLKTSIEKEENKQNFLGLQVLTDAEEKDMENINLRQENELQKERLKTSWLIFFTVIGGLIVFAVFSLMLYKKEKNIRKYAALLEKKNEEINIQNNKLEEVILAKDKFFSILAHNLKNPFWALLGLNKMLDEDYSELSDSEKREIIIRMGSSIENVYKLFEDLLSWAKTQQSAIKPVKENLNAAELIYTSVKPYELRAKEKNVNILVNTDENISFYADRFMLETIIGNFVDNAIKFSKENSNVEVAAYNEDNNFVISIKDFGIGIPDEKIEKLFMLGENISSQGTQNEKGSGLGLIICKEFLKLNNGEIFVESKVNEGTKFSIKLPLEKF